MADNIQYTYWAEPSCPSGTPASAPTTTAIDLIQCYLWRMEVRIPPGHAGLTGIALVDSGAFVVPYDAGGSAWLIGDDDLLEYPYGKQLGNTVALYTYNTDDTYDHGWQVRLIYTPMSDFDQNPEVLVSPDVSTWLEEIQSGEG